MKITSQKFIPTASSAAGLCLTPANWQQVHTNTMAWSLESLLIKPGINLLLDIPNVPQYLGWPAGVLILNAHNLVANKAGIFTCISPYDGSKLKITYEQLVTLILHIKPAAVLLPSQIIQEFPEIWLKWDDSIMPFIAFSEYTTSKLSRSHGIYFVTNNFANATDLSAQINNHADLPQYITGPISIELIKKIKPTKLTWIESDEPAAEGMQGRVYAGGKIIDLTDLKEALRCEVIEAQCGCPTCLQHLTRAYLHHLYLHTPLLAQRFLIQHNIYAIHHYMKNL